MRPSLQLNISQHLALTPQLQQAIRILQLSTIDLQQEIQLVLESNPMLEAIPNEDKEQEELEINTITQQENEQNDFQWSELYHSADRRTSFEEHDYNFDNLHCTTTSLKEHLKWQLNLSSMSDVDRAIAIALIDATNNNGFLSLSIAELHASLTSEEYLLDLDEIEAVRRRLQLFDPVGCACINLAETLLVQLEQLPQNTEYLALAKKIIVADINLLGQHNYKQIMKNHHITENNIDSVLKIIQKLNPNPGYLIHEDITEYIIPDLIVKKIHNQWTVQLNQSVLPHLSINKQYASLIQRADNSTDNQFLKNNLQEARWFLKSIQSRQETLLKVATCIIKYQQRFLEYGEEAMKPLILNHIALTLDLHESTVSRVTTQKFIHTPKGLFELKYFFSSHINTNAGDECSSIAIRAMIKKLIATENKKKPLSDSKMSQLLGKQGIKIARRTVAKYRETIGVAPSHERKIIDN